MGASGGGDDGQSVGQSGSLVGGVSQMSAAHGGKTEEMKGIPMCVVYAHEGVDTGRGGAATGTGGRHGREGRGVRYEERASSDGPPLMCQPAHKAALA